MLRGCGGVGGGGISILEPSLNRILFKNPDSSKLERCFGTFFTTSFGVERGCDRHGIITATDVFTKKDELSSRRAFLSFWLLATEYKSYHLL